MVDIVGLLITAGVSMAEKIMGSWLEKGSTKVRIAQLEQTIAEMSAKEAQNLHVNEADLRRITSQMIKTVIEESLYLIVTKGRLHGPTVTLDPTRGAPMSSAGLLEDLKQRISSLAERERASAAAKSPGEPPLEPSASPTQETGTPRYELEVMPPPTPAGDRAGSSVPARNDKSAELLSELRKRVGEREDRRA